MPGLSGSGTSTPGLSATCPCAPCLSSPGPSAPGSSECGPFSSGPSKFGSSIFDIDIEEVLNKFSQCHPHYELQKHFPQ